MSLGYCAHRTIALLAGRRSQRCRPTEYYRRRRAVRQSTSWRDVITADLRIDVLSKTPPAQNADGATMTADHVILPESPARDHHALENAHRASGVERGGSARSFAGRRNICQSATNTSHGTYGRMLTDASVPVLIGTTKLLPAITGRPIGLLATRHGDTMSHDSLDQHLARGGLC